MDLRNSNDFESRNFYFTTVWKLFSKILIKSGKCITWSSIEVLPNEVSKKSFYTFEDIDFRESPMRRYIKKRVKLWELIQFLG